MTADPWSIWAWAASIALLGCGEDDVGRGGDAAACVEVEKDFPVSINRDLDILFVVDTSPSMADESERLAANAEQFSGVLETVEGGLPNLHIGVVSADVANRGGALEVPEQCSVDGAFLRDVVAYANERDKNYAGALTDALPCMLRLPGSEGAIEQPLEAMRAALEGAVAGNEGFLRERASLFVAILADEDDCSGGGSFAAGEGEERTAWRCFSDGVACDQDQSTPGPKTGCEAVEAPQVLTPVAEYAAALVAHKADPGMVAVATVTAGGDPVVVTTGDGAALDDVCPGEADARPAVRLASFAERFPARSAGADICRSDWSDSLALIAETFRETLSAPCIDAAVDLEPVVEGVQAECSVSAVRLSSSGHPEEIVLPACSSSDPPEAERPCWRIEEDAVCDDGLAFRVFRGRESVLPGYARVRCFAGC